MKLKRYENAIPDIDSTLLCGDEYTFSVLSRIISGKCVLTVTDGERFIVCHSAPPYPVWVWTPNDATAEEMEAVYQVLREDFDLEKNDFNMKHALADFLIKRAEEDNISLSVTMNMLAYSCEQTVAPKRRPSGKMRAAEEGDLETATDLLAAFHRELNMEPSDRESCRQKARELIAAKRLFLWVDGGEAVACCSYREADGKGSVGTVYTKAECRRRGYAAELVCEVTEMILGMGKTPVLYTDGDYAASNAAYASIGYQIRGSLCTLSVNKQR